MLHTRWIARPAIVCFFVSIVCALWLLASAGHSVQAAAPQGSSTEERRQAIQLIIPKIKVDAPIEAVGQDEDGAMAVPKSVETVAWYNLGPTPGESGNAVIAGHLDNVKGQPAVFWRLDELEAGDEIIVRFDDESEARFEVMSVESYALEEVPMTRIFGLDFEHDLNLITCDGDWNKQHKAYDKRLVVYSRLSYEGTNPTEGDTPSTLPRTPPTRTANARQNRQ